MAKNIIKRNGAYQEFNGEKIKNAMRKAFVATLGDGFAENLLTESYNKVIDLIERDGSEDIQIEVVQEFVEDVLIDNSKTREVGKAYIRYRANHAQDRKRVKAMLDNARNVLIETDKMNANIVNSPSARMLQLGCPVGALLAKERFPKEFVFAHENKDIHIHDLDWSLLTVNCLQIPAKRLLTEGFNPGHGFIRPAKHVGSAAAIIAILIQSSQNDMFGGQSIPSFDEAMAPFCGKDVPDKEIFQAMQGLVYNLNSMHARAGAQVPFSSLNIGLDTSEGGRRATEFLLKAYDQGLGRGENPIFPNVIFKVRDGVNRKPGNPNYDLFKLAIKVTAHRMNPTYCFMDTTFNKEYKTVDYMGCRTRVVSNVNDQEQSGVGRGNLFFVTINLPRLGIMANKDINKFFELLDEKIDLCERHLMNRYEYVISHLKVKDMPFVMGQHLYKGSENLRPLDSIEQAVRHGTLSMGFIGLAECLKALVGYTHDENEDALKLGLKIISRMREAMDEMTRKTHLNFSLFGTPAEGLSGRFTAEDRKKFGVIEGVTDREYYTNSVHVPVYHKITHAKKMAIEGQFHKYLNAGHIAYVEFDAPPVNNLLAVERLLNHMADSDIGYAGINFPIDFCDECGYQGVINEDECPICGAKEKDGHIHRVRRITGYFSELQNFNSAKQAEERDRTSVHAF